MERGSQNIHQEQMMDSQPSKSVYPHAGIRASKVDVEDYPELKEAIPDMGEDFFRNPLKDEERKVAIYGLLKFMVMNYSPPPLNGAASTSVKRVDNTPSSI
ncbi:hypothetical protein AYI68_g7167 [Smittium mucronatum]|uniref:Uncharacterized protein n=1 Tax=Smittium mucronatum TaxID=133383 RepID=A0A1R0GPI4_9FUNG|nr:hypothetical protein AYI68_g7167 [Smittium mucronatum]